jgi:hypothetical protein
MLTVHTSDSWPLPPSTSHAAGRSFLVSRMSGDVVRRDERHGGFCSGPPARSSSSPGVTPEATKKKQPAWVGMSAGGLESER